MNSRTFGHIEVNEQKNVIVITQAEPHVTIKLKALFPKLAIASSLPFLFGLTPANATDLLWFADRYPLRISEQDKAALSKLRSSYYHNVSETEQILLPDYQPKPAILNIGEEARNYQLQAADFWYRTKRGILGDDLGLGKTLSAIILLLKPGTLPAVVVVETHMRKQWKEQVERFTNLSVHVLKPTRKVYPLPPADVYVIAYSCLSGGWETVLGAFIKTVIFDEVQNLRNNDSARYSASKWLSNTAEFSIGLSATPIYNYGDEIFNVLDALKEGSLGKREDFLREWCRMRSANKYLVHDPKALGTFIRENYLMLRRTRADVGRELPPINRIIQNVEYDEKEVDSIEKVAAMLAATVTYSTSFIDRGHAARELDALARLATGLAKAKGVASYVRILLENDLPVVLGGWHRDVYKIWLEELKEYNPVMYTGSETGPQKEAAKMAFVNGETNLLILSLRSGAGLDGLQHRCNDVVIGELDWSPKVHEQFIGRVDRDGNKYQTNAHFLVADCGSDPTIIDVLGVKSSQSHNIVNPLLTIADQYSDESRIKLLAKQFLKKVKAGGQI